MSGLVAALKQGLRGRVITREDPDYDAARALYNGMIDKRPRLIARCPLAQETRPSGCSATSPGTRTTPRR